MHPDTQFSAELAVPSSLTQMAMMSVRRPCSHPDAAHFTSDVHEGDGHDLAHSCCIFARSAARVFQAISCALCGVQTISEELTAVTETSIAL